MEIRDLRVRDLRPGQNLTSTLTVEFSSTKLVIVAAWTTPFDLLIFILTSFANFPKIADDISKMKKITFRKISPGFYNFWQFLFSGRMSG